jgi:hypothetical protein
MIKNALTIGFALVNWAGLMFPPAAIAAPANVPPVQSQTHTLVSGTYLGGSGDDQARGVGWTATGELIVGGNFASFGPTQRVVGPVLLGAATTAPGKLLKLSNDGKTILAAVTLGQRIDDLKVLSRENRIVVGGDFGVAVLEASSFNLIWASNLPGLAAGNGKVDGQQTRVAMEPSGRVAVLRDRRVKLFSDRGVELASQTIPQTYPTDIAIDPFGRRLYVTGFSNRAYKGTPVQVPFLTAFATGDQPTLAPIWKTWDYDGALLRTTDPANPKKELSNDLADSRLYRLAIGGDGAVTVLGESAGGNSVFRWNGRDLRSPTLVVLDAYSNTYNSRSNHMLYYAKVDAASGGVLAGQYAVPRLGSGAANTFRAKEGSLAVGPTGILYIGGVSAYGTPGRDGNRWTVAGSAQPVAPYYGEDMVLLTVSSDFKQRFRWTPLSRAVANGPVCVKGTPIGITSNCGGGTINALAVQGSNVALFGTVDFGGLVTSPDGLATQPFNPEDDLVHDAYLAVVKGP